MHDDAEAEGPNERTRASAQALERDAELEMIVETSRWGVVKRRPSGRIEFVSPLPCPYNYGFVPGTRAPDGDPLDVVLLGRRRRRGARVSVRVLGVVDFIDGARGDPKLVAVASDAPSRPRARPWIGIDRFFRVYALFKRALARLRAGDRARADTRFRGWLRHPVSQAPAAGTSTRSRSS